MPAIDAAAAGAVPVIETDGRAIVLDLSNGARLDGQPIAGLGAARLGALIDHCMHDAGTAFAFGRYAEPRELYANDHFSAADGVERRTIHMGIDLFCAAGTAVRAPLAGRVELVANNDRELDYGPMLVIRHEPDAGEAFFTLYGHLGPDVLAGLEAGDGVTAGQPIATVGGPPQNGNWPPHLHLQVITDLKGLGADFPGVAERSKRDYWLGLSPSPAAFFPECERRQLEYAACN